MKFDVLYALRDQLALEDIAANTKKTYYSAVKRLFNGVDFNDVSDISPQFIENSLNGLKTKHDVCAAKRGLEYMKSYFPELQLPESLCEIKKRNCKKRKWEPLDYNKLLHTINGIPNKKLRVAYRLMLATGMRVSEVEQICKQHVSVSSTEVEFHIPSTKNGEPAQIKCQDPYIVGQFQDYAKDLTDTDKLFYSDDTMKKHAGNRGFECHDLRRCFAKNTYKIKRSEFRPYEAVDAVREKMRHKSCRTTKIYLGREIIK